MPYNKKKKSDKVVEFKISLKRAINKRYLVVATDFLNVNNGYSEKTFRTEKMAIAQFRAIGEAMLALLKLAEEVSKD